MPNWCTNYLYLKSDREQSVNEFLTDFKSSGEFEMKNILPVPEELLNPDTTCYGGPLEEQEQREQLKRDLKAKYGYASWYDFCVDVWGTKWDISNPDDDFYLDSNFCYSTAWGPNATFFTTFLNDTLMLNFLSITSSRGWLLLGFIPSKTEMFCKMMFTRLRMSLTPKIYWIS